MLTPDYLESATEDLERLFLEFSNWTYQDIARRLKAAGGFTATAEYQLRLLADSRMFDESYKKRLQKLLDMSDSEVDRLFREAAANSYGYDRDLYVATGVHFVPISENKTLQSLIYSASEQMKTRIHTLTNSTALKMLNPYGKPVPIPQYYSQTLDSIAFQTAAGATSYDEATKRAVKGMVSNGITVVRYEGEGKQPVNRRIEGVVRSNVLTAIGQMADKVTWHNVGRLGANHVIVSYHDGARTGEGFKGHVNWQGKVYALNDYKP